MAKTAIMTRASRGIGREIVKRLAADGCSVVVNYSENSAKADDLRDRARTSRCGAFSLGQDSRADYAV